MIITDLTIISARINKLIKENFLEIDNKKHYSSTGVHKKQVLAVQKNTFNSLSKFAARIYNLSLLKDKY